jgi:hypothetical protein
MAVAGVAVAVTKAASQIWAGILAVIMALLWLLPTPSHASVLPANRGDVMHHHYQGGGVSIDGPAVMLRHNVGQQWSVSGFHYIDTVSGASIDVVATASAYSETRRESRLGADYLIGNSILSMNYAQSDENDYNAKSASVGVAHDTFGGLTTLSMEAGVGNDDVGRNGDSNFAEQVRRYNYKFGLTQIITTRWIAALNAQVDLEEGFLNNPYRSVRYRDAQSSRGFNYHAEIYPRTRNTSAIAVINKYHLPYRAAISLNLRYYQDSWDIQAQDAELEYVHPLDERLTLDARLRFYQQGAADFYRDLFDYAKQFNFMARDKELSEFRNVTLGLGASYKLPSWSFWPSAKPELNLQWDHIRFDYANFRDVTVHRNLANSPDAPAIAVGAEPLYQLDVNVIRAFFSVYF